MYRHDDCLQIFRRDLFIVAGLFRSALWSGNLAAGVRAARFPAAITIGGLVRSSAFRPRDGPATLLSRFTLRLLSLPRARFSCRRGGGLFRLFPLALATHALLIGLSSFGPRCGHVANNEELLAHRPNIRCEPVNKNTDREVNAGYSEDAGKNPHHHLLLLGHRVIESLSRHVLHERLTR